MIIVISVLNHLVISVLNHLIFAISALALYISFTVLSLIAYTSINFLFFFAWKYLQKITSFGPSCASNSACTIWLVGLRWVLRSMRKKSPYFGRGVRSSKATAARLTSCMRSATSVSFSCSTLAMTSLSPPMLLCNSSKRSLVRSKYSSVFSRTTDKSWTFSYNYALPTCSSPTSRLSCSISSELSSFFFASTLQSSSCVEIVSFKSCTLRYRDLTYSTLAIFRSLSHYYFNRWHSVDNLAASRRPPSSVSATSPYNSAIFLSRTCSHSAFVFSTVFSAFFSDTPSLRRYFSEVSGSARKRKGRSLSCRSANTSRKLLSTSEKLLRTKKAARAMSSPLSVFCCTRF